MLDVVAVALIGFKSLTQDWNCFKINVFSIGIVSNALEMLCGHNKAPD
jgi:hypothetical protein